VKPPLDPFTDEIWLSLCETELVRPECVAAGRARLAANDWPTSLDLADAILDREPRPAVAIC
jgi:hypothetical protein